MVKKKVEKANDSIAPGDFLTVVEAAEIGRVSEVTIRKKLTEGVLTRHKIFGRTLVRRDELLSLIKAE